MKSATRPAFHAEPERLDALEAVPSDIAAASDFVEHDVRGAMTDHRTQAAFLARGEQAWQQYLRTGQSRPVGEVSDRVRKRIDARRQELLAKR